MMMQLSQAAQVLHARLLAASGRTEFSGVSTDTRKLVAGDLYVALRGEKFDGADFVAQAAASGAAAALVNADSYHGEAAPCPLLLVEDTRIALGQLAAHWRRQFDIPLAAITGSNGKTTVKEMLAAILRAAAGSSEAVLATTGNLNNDIGMPLTLLRLNAGHRFAVIEMGMNHPGEIDYLTMIARPNVALVNNASGAHLEGMGSVEAVAHAKGEIFAGLQHDGSAIINADDAHAPLWRKLVGANPLLEFGLTGMADVTPGDETRHARSLTPTLSQGARGQTRRCATFTANNQADVSGSWQPHHAGMRLEARTPSGDFVADMQVPGEHNARNALAATAAAIALNVPLESIVAGLEAFGGVPGRLQKKPGRRGATVLDDTYNANPASMRAAIGVLAQAAGKRVLVLGDMGELGCDAAAFHAEIGEAAREAGIEKLYALGELSREAVRAFGDGALHCETLEALQAALEKELDANTTVLVKGSRFMKMERVVAYCADSEIKE